MENLIESVRKETCLYDTSHPEYSKKTLKDYLWTKIAKESKYKNGQAAKDAWLKLRNCHRDAIRRRNKIYTSTSEAVNSKPWKFEKQMEFLIPYMTTRVTGDSAAGDNSSQEFDLNQSENAISYPDIQFVSSQQTDPFGVEGCSRTHASGNFADGPRAEKRPYDHTTDDDLQQFFNTMYTITKKMPALSQHKLKRQIFNLVSDEEEHLLTQATVTKLEPVSPKVCCSDDE